MRRAISTVGTTSRNHPAGFSLIELMVTVMILAIIASLAMPSIGTAFRQQSIAEATNEIMHLVDFSRIQAMSRNKAYEMNITTGGSDNGSVAVNESKNTRCDGFEDGIPNIRGLNFDVGEFSDIRIISAEPNGLGTTFQLCFKPSGRVVRTDTAKPLPSTVSGYGAGEAHVVIQRLDSSNKVVGPKHRIVIPYNGIPRFETGG